MNTLSDLIYVFNAPCDAARWETAHKPDFLFFDLLVWIDSEEMSAEEKELHPEHETTGGFLRKLSYKEAFKQSWISANPNDRRRIIDLPNWDNEVFKEISGIDVHAELGIKS